MKQVSVRQGDVLLVPVKKIPRGYKKVDGDVVLALGETTGHSHRFEEKTGVCGFFKEGAEDHTIGGGSKLVGGATSIAFITVPTSGADLKHVGELPHGHDPIHVAPGSYEVRRQREYVADGIERAVVD